ncbi:MAG: hypothetical protein SGI90_04980 [Candidatus Eisenbacteria bacterium]|nr:hypothetical protein [Candidatus Eisenbacteria bacterium]
MCLTALVIEMGLSLLVAADAQLGLPPRLASRAERAIVRSPRTAISATPILIIVAWNSSTTTIATIAPEPSPLTPSRSF